MTNDHFLWQRGVPWLSQSSAERALMTEMFSTGETQPHKGCLLLKLRHGTTRSLCQGNRPRCSHRFHYPSQASPAAKGQRRPGKEFK